MPDIARILCPMDFSPASRHALAYASALARWYGARLIGLHVYSPVFVPVPAFEMAGYPTVPTPDDEVDLGAFRGDLQKELSGAGTNLPVEAIVTRGNITDEILEAARALPADMIVMGTHGVSGFQHLVLGSVTEKVLRKAHCPVLTVSPRSHEPRPMPFGQILCPVDFSDLSPAIVEFARSLAQKGTTKLTLLHVLEWSADEDPLPHRHFNVPEYRRYREADAADSMKALVASQTLDETSGIETRFVHGKPYREILSTAAQQACDLIVMGVHGRNPFDLMMFGSTTNHVVRRATCPVLTLRP